MFDGIPLHRLVAKRVEIRSCAKLDDIDCFAMLEKTQQKTQ